MSKNTDAKKTMLLHSEAKVEFLKKYIERYLRILYLARHIDEINIYDVFCGTGIYDNGKKGSPIVAFDAIKSLRIEYDLTKNIRLVVNDSDPSKVATVENYINDNNQNYCAVEYYNLPADEMFNKINDVIDGQSRNTRNLIFIDPYGYKEIKQTTLQNLLGNKRTEIILFLPISQMQRFTVAALENESKPYAPLREFVFSFFPSDHPVREKTVKALDYISYIKEALKFGEYFSSSYFIERDESNYYALFFVSPLIYGLEKILEVKWQLDDDEGRGFKQPEAQLSMFEMEDKELTKTDNYQKLEQILENALKLPKTNHEVYEIILDNEFLPKHAGEIFRDWQKYRSNFKVTEIVTNKPARKGGFYITWESYNPQNNSEPKVIFAL